MDSVKTQKKRGSLAEFIEAQCDQYFSGAITDEQYKDGIKQAVTDFADTPAFLQVGLAIQRHYTKYKRLDAEKAEKFWSLAKEVEPQIYLAFLKYRRVMRGE